MGCYTKRTLCLSSLVQFRKSSAPCFPLLSGGELRFSLIKVHSREGIYIRERKKRVLVGSYFFCYRHEHAKQQQTHMAGFSGEGALLAPPCNSVLTQKGSEIQIIFHLVCSCLPASLSPRNTLGLAATTS